MNQELRSLLKYILKTSFYLKTVKASHLSGTEIRLFITAIISLM